VLLHDSKACAMVKLWGGLQESNGDEFSHDGRTWLGYRARGRRNRPASSQP
jgi:hypothetical protein